MASNDMNDMTQIQRPAAAPAAEPALVLQVQHHRNQPLTQPLLGRFGPDGGTLGRAPGNDLVLEDASKYISRSHARVQWRDGAFYLMDVGANPSIVNDRPLGAGVEARLSDGDSIVIGDYLLTAIVPAPQPVPAAAPISAASLWPAAADAGVQTSAPAPGAAAPPPASADPWSAAGLQAHPLAPPAPRQRAQDVGPTDALASASILRGGEGGAGLADPLGLNLFGGLAPPSPPAAPGQYIAPAFRGAESDHVAPELQAVALPPGSFSGIPADYDPLADLLPKAPAPAPAPAPETPPAGKPIGAMPEPARPIAAVSADAAPAAMAHPAAIPAAPPAAAQPAIGPAGDNPPAAHHARAPQPSAPVAPAHTAPSTANDSAILQALLDGIGLPQLRSAQSPEALAHDIGRMLRAATAGTMDVLLARALTKRESHIDMTMISPRANNPLKFFPDADTALTQMLSTQIPGYLPPVDAIESAFDDLKAHEMAVIAGMRAALAAVVQRFDPARIEQRLSAPGRMDKLLPAARKARMWDRLVELYGELARDADEDLQRLFGEKFSVAYEQQVARLRSARS